MASVKVWNDNRFPYREKFKGKEVTIPAHSSVDMEDDEAVLFLGTMGRMEFGADGRQKPESYKNLRIEKNPTRLVADEPVTVKCHACGFTSDSDAVLDDHIAQNHTEQMVHNDLAAAMSKVEEIKRKRGRPPKPAA